MFENMGRNWMVLISRYRRVRNVEKIPVGCEVQKLSDYLGGRLEIFGKRSKSMRTCFIQTYIK